MSEVVLANGCVKATKGTWLMAHDQPVAVFGLLRTKGIRGFIAPDRSAIRVVELGGEAYLSSSERPFLTRLDAPPDRPVSVVASKVLIAPAESRIGSRQVKLVPFSFRRATPVTGFIGGWVVTASRGRVTRVVVDDGATLTVRHEAVVAWIGKDPTGFCPRLKLTDILLPRGPKNLAYSFHGPCVVWFEGTSAPERRLRGMGVWR